MLYKFNTDSVKHASAALLLYAMYRSRNKNSPLNGLETWDRFNSYIRGACLKSSTTIGDPTFSMRTRSDILTWRRV